MILLCYDGSDDANAAIDRATTLFAGAPATVLTIWQPYAQMVTQNGFGFAYVMPAVEADEIDAATERDALATAHEGADRAARAGMAAQARVEAPAGAVPGAILEIAREIDADAIVVGTRGRGGLRSMLLGSVSHAVVQHADRPVVIVPSPAIVRARHAVRETIAPAPVALSGG